MNEEEKKAIKDLKREFKDSEICEADLIVELANARIILNLVEKQQKQLEEKENIIRKANVEAQKYFDITMEQTEEIAKKDKIIDLIAEELVDVSGDCPFDRYDYREIDCDNVCNNDGIEKECWIEYFTKKASEE